MARRVDGSLGALLQGISQQPARQRLQGQVTDQVNMTSDAVRMLHRRPPTQFIGGVSVGTVDVSKSLVHFMELADGNKYYVIIPPLVNSANDIILLNAETGARNQSITVTNQFLAYVSVDSPIDTIKMVTVGNTTFVVNSETTVTMESAVSDPFVLATAYLRDSARIDVDVGQYNRKYTLTVTVNGTSTSVTHTTPASTAGGAESQIATDYIATQLETLMNAETAFTNDFNIKRKAGEIILWPKSQGLDYSISGHDGIGGGAMKISSKNVVSQFNDLPTRAPHNSVYTISGASGEADDIYMRFNAKEPSSTDPDLYFQEGTWVETLKPDSQYIIDKRTMPHLIRLNGSMFEFYAAGELSTDPWANKIVGDEVSDKNPEFIGKEITDIITFQDRLVVLAGEYVHMSVTSDFFNFWKKTVNTLLDDGPIGLSALSNEISNLQYAAQHNNDLIVFATKRQFKIPGSPAVTPRNATMTETTSFKIQTAVRPSPAGQNLFFAVDSGTYSGIREFYTDSDLASNNATPVTVAVERLIKGKIRKLASSTNLDKLAVLAEDKKVLYMYEYLWDQNEKVQEAWSKWQFGDDVDVISMNFRVDNLDVLVKIGQIIQLLTISLNTDTELVLGEDVYLDRRLTVTATTTAEALTLPTDLSRIDAIQGTGCPNPGLRAEIQSYDGTTLTFKRDMQGGTVYAGVKFSSSVTPTMPYVRDAQDLAIGTSTLTVGEMYINFENSGDFNVNVDSDYSYTTRNPGRVLGEVSSTLGEYDLTSGQFPVAVRGSNEKSSITIETDSPYPLTINDIEWDGQFYKRGTRITRR